MKVDENTTYYAELLRGGGARIADFQFSDIEKGMKEIISEIVGDMKDYELYLKNKGGSIEIDVKHGGYGSRYVVYLYTIKSINGDELNTFADAMRGVVNG